jgi:cytochrome c-type biogenesis protein CcmH/NrfG
MEVRAMINQGSSSAVRTRSVAEAAIHNLESWWRHSILDHLEASSDWTGDARFHLGQARRALDHGDIARARREASRALEMDNTSPWALVVLGRCALAQNRPGEAVQAFSRAYNRAPSNRYVTALLARAAESAADAADG